MQGKKKTLYSIVNPKVSQSPRKNLFPIKLNILRVMLLIQHFRTNIITKSR